MRGRKNTKCTTDSRSTSQSAGASVASLNMIADSDAPSIFAQKKRTIFSTGSASSSDIRDVRKSKNSKIESIRSSSASTRKRRWWFQKVSGSFYTSHYTLLYDRMVSRRLVSAIAAWHDIHSNLLQLSLSRQRQSSRTRKKLDTEHKTDRENDANSTRLTISGGSRHTCERQNHNHHYHYHSKNHHVSQKTNDVDVKSNSSVTSLTSNLTAIHCRHHCHRHHSQKKSKRGGASALVDDELIHGKENQDGEEMRCGSLCGMNSICCSSICSSLSCMSASPASTSHSSSCLSLPTASSLSSSPSPPSSFISHNHIDSRPLSAMGGASDSSPASTSNLRFPDATGTKIRRQKMVDIDDDAVQFNVGQASSSEATRRIGSGQRAAPNSDDPTTPRSNHLQPPMVQHLRHHHHDYDASDYSGSRAGDGLKSAHSFNHSTPCTPSVQSPADSPSRNSIAAFSGSDSATPRRRHFLRMKTHSPSQGLYHSKGKCDNFSDTETQAILPDEDETLIANEEKRRRNTANHNNNDDYVARVSDDDSENSEMNEEEDDNDENLMSDAALDEVLECERKAFNRMSLSSPELTALEIKQMFPDLSDHWR